MVYASYQGLVVLVGYYALATKIFVIRNTAKLTYTLKQRLKRFAKYDFELDQYSISAPLIGQLSKNYTNAYNQLITGDELLKLACDRVQKIQRDMGGKLVYLECANNQKLVSFYESNGFRAFDIRELDREDAMRNGNPRLVQMLKYF